MGYTGTATSFIVRVVVDPAGQFKGTVERARTGEKQRFEGIDAIPSVIARMMAAEEVEP